MQRAFLLDVLQADTRIRPSHQQHRRKETNVIRKGSAVFELLAGEDQALLVGRDAFLVLDLGLDGINCVGGLDFKRDRLAGQGLDKDLHATAQSQDEMKRRFL